VKWSLAASPRQSRVVKSKAIAAKTGRPVFADDETISGKRRQIRFAKPVYRLSATASPPASKRVPRDIQNNIMCRGEQSLLEKDRGPVRPRSVIARFANAVVAKVFAERIRFAVSPERFSPPENAISVKNTPISPPDLKNR